VKLALSRKNLWEKLPRPVKTTIGSVLNIAPPRCLLGRGFRQQQRFVEEAQWWPAEKVKTFQLAELRRICTLAYEKAPYYKRLFAAVNFHPSDLKQVEDLRLVPMLSKDVIREHLDEMCTVTKHSPWVDYTTTGGTGGAPLSFYIDANRSLSEYAYLVSGWQRAGFRLGTAMAVFRGRVVPEERPGWRHDYDPIFRYHFYSNFHMTDENMQKYLDHVRHIGPCYLHVYPSSATMLARYILRSGAELPRNVQGIIAESEIIYPDQRQLIEAVFKRRLFSCYGLTEKIVAAAECEHSTNYHIWPTYGFFELVDEQGGPVITPGQRGEIVGTGFINTVMPFIRYRTGDFATYVGDRCDACKREHTLISDIRGHRIQETFVASDGARISWTALNMHDNTFDRVLRFQFYQDTPGRARLRLVPARGFSDDDQARIQRNLGVKFDGRMNICIEIVDYIPLSRSGKAIYVDQCLPDAISEREAA
jgi:phenylacetate-CoA ligase